MRPPEHTEGDAKTCDFLDRDANALLHQALSSPCASTIAKAKGIWIEDTTGRRFMDFNGNSVHHIGYGHPRLIVAIKDQLDTLPFLPRRFTNGVFVVLLIAAVIARHDLDVVGDFAIGHYTHEKNQVTALAALKTLDVVAEKNLYERAAKLVTFPIKHLTDLIRHRPNVDEMRGRARMFGVDMVMDRDSRESITELAKKVCYSCLENGVSFKISAGSVLTLSPPLTVSRSDLKRALSIVTQALGDML